MDEIVVQCNWCGECFEMERPIFIIEHELAACPECRWEAKENTKEMEKERKLFLKWKKENSFSN